MSSVENILPLDEWTLIQARASGQRSPAPPAELTDDELAVCEAIGVCSDPLAAVSVAVQVLLEEAGWITTDSTLFSPTMERPGARRTLHSLGEAFDLLRGCHIGGLS